MPPVRPVGDPLHDLEKVGFEEATPGMVCRSAPGAIGQISVTGSLRASRYDILTIPWPLRSGGASMSQNDPLAPTALFRGQGPNVGVPTCFLLAAGITGWHECTAVEMIVWPI
jgi:hypothetical protein